MISLSYILAQAAETLPASVNTSTPYAIDWERWFAFPGWPRTFAAITTFFVIVAAGIVFGRIFRSFFKKNRLTRQLVIAVAVFSIYFSLLALHPRLVIGREDLLAVIIYRVFVAFVLLLFIRFIDRVLIVPGLTRGGRVPLSTFIHQIAIVVLLFFFTVGYFHWAFDFDLTSILAGSAVVSIILGLALQETLGNFFSGMVLQASTPFSIGDWIQIGDVEGRVVEMSWRAVTIRTGANNNVLIPNSVIAKDRVINYHTPVPTSSFWIAVGVDANIPPNDVRRVLIAAASETNGVLADPAPSASLFSFDASSITYRVGFWISDPPTHGTVEEAVRTNVWYRLKQAGYAIPNPIRTIEMADAGSKQRQQQETDIARRLAALNGSQVFDALTDAQKKRLAENTRDFCFAARQIIYRQGDTGSSSFILLEGTLSVFMKAVDGKEYSVDDIVAVALFGELSAMTDHPRAETLRAKTDVRVLEITRDHVRQLITESPHLADPVAKVVAQRHADRQAKLDQLSAPSAPTPQPESHSASSILSRMRRLFGGH